jgi:hypothetical protein
VALLVDVDDLEALLAQRALGEPSHHAQPLPRPDLKPGAHRSSSQLYEK